MTELSFENCLYDDTVFFRFSRASWRISFIREQNLSSSSLYLLSSENISFRNSIWLSKYMRWVSWKNKNIDERNEKRWKCYRSRERSDETERRMIWDIHKNWKDQNASCSFLIARHEFISVNTSLLYDFIHHSSPLLFLLYLLYRDNCELFDVSESLNLVSTNVFCMLSPSSSLSKISYMMSS